MQGANRVCAALSLERKIVRDRWNLGSQIPTTTGRIFQPLSSSPPPSSRQHRKVPPSSRTAKLDISATSRPQSSHTNRQCRSRVVTKRRRRRVLVLLIQWTRRGVSYALPSSQVSTSILCTRSECSISTWLLERNKWLVRQLRTTGNGRRVSVRCRRVAPRFAAHYTHQTSPAHRELLAKG